jgi:signal transduction histidine kinase
LRSGCLRAWAGAVALVSAAVAVLKPYVPLLSLGVLYELAVLPVAVLWGLVRLATAVSVSSMLAFNRFFLRPTHTLQLSDGANWLALATYLVTGIVVGLLATRARRRAELIAENTLEAEAVRRSDAMKTAVLHAVSHDLRSPLIRRETLSPRDHTDAVPPLSAGRYRRCYDRDDIEFSTESLRAQALLSASSFSAAEMSALGSEWFAFPIAPTLTQSHSQKLRHQIKFGRPDILESR